MSRLGPKHVRTRLTVWYVAVLAGTLLLYGAGTAALVLYQLRAELDHLASDDLESVEGLLSFGADGKLSLRSNYHDHPYPTSAQDRLLEVLGSDGSILYRNDLLGDRTLGSAPSPAEGLGGYSVRSIRLPDGTAVRVVSKQHNIEGRPTLIRVGFSEEILWRRFWQISIGMLAGLPLALGLAGAGGYLLAKHALDPIDRMARRVHEINVDRLNARLEIENPDDELGALAKAFNETLARLERSFEQLRRFTADASHELRTPLTALRSVGEVGLRKQRMSDDYRDVIASMLEEANRLSRLVDSLLMLSRAESGQIQLHRTVKYLTPFAREAVNFFEVLADEKGQRLSVDGDETVQAAADFAILRQVLINLVDNAIKNSPRGGAISVRILGLDDGTATIEVEDSGPGIAVEHRDKVFDRFYRVDEGRSREAGGTGLGLSIAKWGVEAHGGRLELECPNRGGCVFRILLPTVADLDSQSQPQAQSAVNGHLDLDTQAVS